MHDSENDGHVINRKLWDSAIQQIYQEYPLPDLPDNWLSKCNEMAENFDPSLEGREPDFAVYTFANQEKENLLIVKVKSSKRASSNKEKLNDLGNRLKDCIEELIDDGIDDNVPVCGILVKARLKCTLYIMDLQYIEWCN
ncbi:24895_t:CDS:2 [Gigaspora margarita]|uniref:24895_t:CDS:1 n=1 Tax=Gigaspora margarita TaxID=4874 RepID=A0ABN7UL99_GIGMA|nr:24895_t:CDS:2 [Gigaspora margarita]